MDTERREKPSAQGAPSLPCILPRKEMEMSDVRHQKAVVYSKWLQKPVWNRRRKTSQRMRLVREYWRSQSRMG